MKRVFIDILLILVISLIYLFGIIATRIPFFIIFLIGLVLLIAGLITALFYDKGTKGRRMALIISFAGLMSSLEIWFLSYFLIARLQ